MAELQPMFRAYTIIDRKNGDPFWLNIGVAFIHRDTKGLNIMLQALPLDGKLVLRNYDETLAESATVVPSHRPNKKATTLEQA